LRSHSVPFCVGDNQAIHDALVQQQTTTTVGIMARSSGHIFAAAAASLVAADEFAVISLVDESAATAAQLSNSSKAEAVVIIPTHESLMAIKHKKKLLTNGTEQFNMKPSKVTSCYLYIKVCQVNVYYLNAVRQRKHDWPISHQKRLLEFCILEDFSPRPLQYVPL
jgi:hypothetical protein